jgi:hypothetical protein
MLQATISDAMRIVALRSEVEQIRKDWSRDITFYEPTVFRDMMLGVYDAANTVLTFERRYADRYMDPATRATMRRQVETIYGAGGVLDRFNQKYLQAMKTGLATNALVEAPDFRDDALDAMREILSAYEIIVHTQAADDFMDSEIAQKGMAGLLAFSAGARAVVRGAGAAAAVPGRAIVKAAKATGRGFGKIVIIAVVGAAAVTGAFYYFSRRRQRKEEG